MTERDHVSSTTASRWPPSACPGRGRWRPASGSASAPATSRPSCRGVSHFLEHLLFKGTPTRSGHGDLARRRPRRWRHQRLHVEGVHGVLLPAAGAPRGDRRRSARRRADQLAAATTTTSRASARSSSRSWRWTTTLPTTSPIARSPGSCSPTTRSAGTPRASATPCSSITPDDVREFFADALPRGLDDRRRRRRRRPRRGRRRGRSRRSPTCPPVTVASPRARPASREADVADRRRHRAGPPRDRRPGAAARRPRPRGARRRQPRLRWRAVEPAVRRDPRAPRARLLRVLGVSAVRRRRRLVDVRRRAARARRRGRPADRQGARPPRSTAASPTTSSRSPSATSRARSSWASRTPARGWPGSAGMLATLGHVIPVDEQVARWERVTARRRAPRHRPRLRRRVPGRPSPSGPPRMLMRPAKALERPPCRTGPSTAERRGPARTVVGCE